jgi:hypothetical protein
MRLAETRETTIGFSSFGAEPSADETLQFFIRPQAEHFFATTDGVLQLEVIIDELEELVELKSVPVAKDIDQLIGDMIRNTAGEAGFTGRCRSHRDLRIAQD